MDLNTSSQNNNLITILLEDNRKFQDTIKRLNLEIEESKIKLRKTLMENGALLMRNKMREDTYRKEKEEQNKIIKQMEEDSQVKISNLEQEIKKIKAAMLKVNMENGSLISKEQMLYADLERTRAQVAKYQALSEEDEAKMIRLEQTIAELTQKKSMLSNTCSILVRQQRESNELKQQMDSQIKKLQEDLYLTQTRESNFTYTTAVNMNKILEDNMQLKQFNQALIQELAKK
jgi:hypothetical protein